MALRIRRGTEAQLQLITPVEGELIYTTDSKDLYVGDGTTVGGVKVGGDIPTSINDLNDVNLSGISVGQVLKWNGSSFVPGDDDTVVGTSEGVIEGSNYRINIAADDSTILVDINSKQIKGTLIGDVVGSVFADDSTLLVDALSGTILGTIKGDIETDNVIDVYRTNFEGIKFNIRRGTTDLPITPNNFDRSGIKWASYNSSTQSYQDIALVYGYHQTNGSGYVAISATNSSGVFFNSSIELDGNNDTIILTGNNIVATTNNVPTSSVGQLGDTLGMIAVDATAIYYCIANYDALNPTANIWVKQDWSSTGAW